MGKVLDTAVKLAWAKGTKKKKYTYKSGKPTKAFRIALKKVFPKRKWSPAARKGASCDVAVAVCARYSGVAKKYPRGRDKQRVYEPKKMRRIAKKNARPIDYAKKGDIILYDRTKGGKKGHTFIYGGDRLYEAANKKTYFHTVAKPENVSKKMNKKYKKIIILREK